MMCIIDVLQIYTISVICRRRKCLDIEHLCPYITWI